jgi:Sap, sulfolipid-1-addressing protein
MAGALLNLLPIVVGSAVVPVWIIVVLLLLRAPDGLAKALGFVGGITAVRIAQGILFGLVFKGANESGGSNDPKSFVSMLLLVVGILMILTAVKMIMNEEDPDAPPPKWMAMVESMSPLKAVGVGALWIAIAAKQWVFMLSAIAVISDARIGVAQSVITYLIFVLLAGILVIIPIALYISIPEQSAALLAKAGTWLEEHNRIIVILVSAIFGTYFIVKSLAAML